MPTASSLTKSRSSSPNLDGRRPTAGGMPSNEEGNLHDYSYWYNRAHNHYKRYYEWNSDRWRQEIAFCADAHYTYAQHDGWMMCLWEMLYQQIDRENRQQMVSEARDKLSRELGPREFTLTFSPAWYADNELAKDAMRVAIDRLTRYYKHDIIEFHAIGEYTEAGRPHVHCYYELDGGNKITDKNFKRAWTHWNPRKKLGSGHEGGHHANVRSKSDFLGYIEKDLDEAWMNIHITNASTTDRTAQTRGELLQEASSGSEAESEAV